MDVSEWEQVVADLCFWYKMTPAQVSDLTFGQVHVLNSSLPRLVKAAVSR